MSKTTKLAIAGGAPVHDHPSLLGGHVPGAGLVRSALPWMRLHWRKLVRRALLIVAIPCALYLVVANVLLRTRILRNAVSGSSVNFAVTGDSADLRLDYASAYSLLPGRVHVEGLTLRGRERTVEWALTLDDADVRIALGDLLHHTFHATRLRSSGFTIRARMRLDRVDATADVVAALPPIAGFADPPLLSEEPALPPLTDAAYHLWALDLEDVDVAHVREVWIHTLRAEGDTHVAGRWLFHPQRWLDVGPATVDANGMDFSYGTIPLATGVRGSFGAAVHGFDLRQVNGLEILDHVSYDGRVQGRAFLASVARLLAPRSGVHFTRWEGPFEAHVILDHGKLVDATRAWAETTDGAIEAGGLILEAPVRARLGVDGDLATLDARVSDLRVSHQGAERARVTSVTLAVTSHGLQLAHLGGDAHFALEVGGARANDLGAWQRYLLSTSTFAIQSGTVTASGHAEGSLVEGGGWAAGDATIAGHDLAVGAGPATFAGSVSAHVELRRATWRDRRVDLSGSNAVLRTISAKSTRSGMAVLEVPSLTMAAPHLSLTPSSVEGLVAIDLPRADLVHLGRLGELVSLPRGLVVEDGRGRASLQADVELGTRAVRGDGEVVLRGVRARAGSTQLFGDLDCTLKARHAGVEGSTDLSGTTLSMTRAGTGNAASVEDAWWARGALSEATLWTRGGMHFGGRAHVTAKDASPATALVSQNTAVPAWAANIFRMPVLDADAELRVTPSSFEVRSLLAHGGNASVRAEYTTRNGRKDGAVLLDLGWIDLGYDLAEGSAGLVLLGPDAWFARKTAILRDAAAASRRKADAAQQIARYAAMTPGARRDVARALAAQCALDVRSCDGASVETLLRAAADPTEQRILGGIAYAPMVVAAAKEGKDGATLDPVVVGSVAEALKLGGESTVDDMASVERSAAASRPDAARGKVITVAGRVSSNRREGGYSIGTLTTDVEPVTFVTPFASPAVSETLARFRGVFVERYAPAIQAPSLVLVGAFVP